MSPSAVDRLQTDIRQFTAIPIHQNFLRYLFVNKRQNISEKDGAVIVTIDVCHRYRVPIECCCLVVQSLGVKRLFTVLQKAVVFLHRLEMRK